MQSSYTSTTRKRIRLMYAAILIISGLFVARLFYLQVIRHAHFQAEAQASQLKRYEIAADRGIIYAMDGSERVPLVLNELIYRVVADPEIIYDKDVTADKISQVIGVNRDEIRDKLESKSRYEILAKKQPKEVKEKIEQLYADGEINGVFVEKSSQRVYPQGALAAQVIGFVNDEGKGNYGIEEFMNAELAGTNGRVKALTDQNGVALLANGENVLEEPIDGQEITLTLDIAMQKQVEAILKEKLEAAQSDSGSAIVLDVSNGHIKAMANYPTYDPAKFNEVTDTHLFTNTSVSSPLEPGSVMKSLTTAAALDAGAVSKDQTYFDPSYFKIDDATVRNIEEDGGAGVRSVSDIMRLSLNTGATWLLMQMGGGELNEQGRKTWNDYMVNHFQFGKVTNVEQGYEEPGYIPNPVDGWGLNIQYANTSFGQGMTVTPLQMAAALASVVNGGTYYQPTLIAGSLDDEGNFSLSAPKVVKSDVVSSEVSNTIVEFMETTLAGNSFTRGYAREGYAVGGKTGTAEIAKPEGGYYEDKFNGTYTGFVGGDVPQYVIMVRVNEPKIGGYAGSAAAGPLFGAISNMLLDNFSVRAKTGN